MPHVPGHIAEVEEQVAREAQRFRGVGSYALVLLFIAATFVSQAFVADGVVLRLGHLWLQVATLLLAIWTARPTMRLMRLSVVGSAAVAIIGTAALLGLGEDFVVAAQALSLTLILIGYVVVIMQVFRSETVDLESILAAVSAYLLIGMGFTAAFQIIGVIDGRFFTEAGHTTSDYFFFSFSTLTTVGYGDLVPATPLGRTMAMVEALVGQLYLVTIIATVVGNVERHRRDRGGPRGRGPGVGDAG